MSKIFECATKNRALLRGLKNLMVRHQQYEVAADLRELEVKYFPMDEAKVKAVTDAEKLVTAFAMAGMTVSPKQAFLLSSISEEFKIFNGNLDMDRVGSLISIANDLFD